MARTRRPPVAVARVLLRNRSWRVLMIEIPAVGPYLDFDDFTVQLPERGTHGYLPCAGLPTAELRDTAGDGAGVWLARSRAGHSLIIPDGVDVVRNGRRVIGLAVLHHGDRVAFAGQLAWFSEVRQLRLPTGHVLVGHRCQQCHTTFTADSEVVLCPLCGEGYCEDCWEHLRGVRCYSRDCHMVPVPVGRVVAT
ncbi:hypothetical protein [Micromonospora matsumotoense]|uniref:hypothetical protein n=1 Tax=Micromonospora matsumotoense TaxID=121616 RepID=UPI0033F583C0